MSAETTKWERRPRLAMALRILVALAPIAASVVAVTVVGRFVTRPSGLAATIGWWAGLTAVATTVLWLSDRAMRRLLPVVALFKLSLVFPDRAPSRFKAAIRAGTVRQLQRQVEAGELSSATPQEAAEQLIALAASLNAHDRLTRGHTERVRAYSAMIGEEMGLSADELELLNWSGLIHDIGKLAVPPEILNKPGKPTDEEWAVLRDHPARADELVAPLRPFLGQWAESATQHHERFDGAGYPNGLAGRDITLAGRIVAVADAYDVMTSTRSYKKAMAPTQARAELSRNAGTQFDPEVVRAFLNIAIGRLRLIMGPLSSLVQFPAGGASLGSSVATGAGAVGSVAVAAVAGTIGQATPVVEPLPEIVAYVAPVADDIALWVTEDQPLTVMLGDHLSPPGDDVRSVTLLSRPDPHAGTVSLSDDGELRFRPSPHFNGTVQLDYRVCFADRSCDDAVVTITVEGVDDAPIAAPDRVSLAEDSAATVDVTTNDRDDDGDPLTVLAAAVAPGGDRPPGDPPPAEVTVEGGRLVVIPRIDFWGTFAVDYTVGDPSGLTDSSTLTVEVTPVDDEPIAVADRVTGYENLALDIDVLANDVDVDGDDLTVVSLAEATGGAATTDGTTVRFVPDPGFFGPAYVRYTVSDGASTASAGVDIDVVDITDRPVVVDDAVVAAEDTPVEIDVTANDDGLGTALDLDSVAIVRAPSVGTATWTGTVVRYTPAADWSGDDDFEYVVCDVESYCNRATASITVTAVNDAPGFVVGADVVVGEDGGPQVLAGWVSQVSVGPADEVGQSVGFTVATTDPGLFSVLPAVDPAGVLRFTPAPDANGVASVIVTAVDSGGTAGGGVDTSAAATASITVTAVNDAPGFVVGADVVVGEDGGPQVLAGWVSQVSVGPADEVGQSVGFTVATTDPGLFSVLPAVDPAGVLRFTPAPDANGVASVIVTAVDSGGTAGGGVDTSAAATASITVTAVNDNPTAIADSASVVEDDPAGVTFDVLANDSDLDGDTVGYGSAVTATVVNGTLTDHGDGTFTYVPDQHFNGTEMFSYTVLDGQGGAATATVTLLVSPAPDAPTASNDARATQVDAPLSVAAPGVLTNDYDVDDEPLTVDVTPVAGPSNGTLTLGADGSYLYTPGSGFVGTDTFTYRVSDPGGATATATVTIIVDSGIVEQAYYLGDSGAWSWDYDLVPSPPPSTVPPADVDGDGSPGLTIDAGTGSEFTLNPADFQVWRTTASGAPLELAGPVVLDLWATVHLYDNAKKSHPYVFLYDCLGLSCTKLAEVDVHLDPYAAGAGDFVLAPIDLGSVNHTVPAGRDLVVRLQFRHEDMWIGLTADYPSALRVTLANQAPVAAADSATIDEDDPATNLAVLANDSDADLDPSSVTVSTAASAGTAVPVGDGTIDYTPDPDANGVDSFVYQVCDLGGNCDTATVTVTVQPVNDQPTFTGGGNVTASGPAPQTFPAWATAISAGAADESGQVLTFTVVSNSNPALFSTAPAVDPVTGDLTFRTSGPGVATVELELSDDGGSSNGGIDTSNRYSFTITSP